MILRIARFGLAGLCLLLGSALIIFSATSWQSTPAFFLPGNVAPASWAAFCLGMSAVGAGLLGLTAFALWRTRGFLLTFSSRPAAAEFMQVPIRPPRYLMDVSACLAVAVIALSAPVLLSGGAPQALLAPFWTTLLVIGLAGGGMLGAVRR